MENPFENKINNDELIFLENDVIFKSKGIHTSIADKFKNVPEEVITYLKDLSIMASSESAKAQSLDKELQKIKSKPLRDVEQKIEPEEGGILSFLELMNKEFTEIPWDVEGTFESGTINMISAPPNQYKSWVVQHIAICLAQGKNVFGKFKTKTQNVLIVNEEDNLRMMKDRSLKMIEEVSELGVHFLVGSGFKIDEGAIEKILIEAQSRNVTFVIFDSLRSIHTANENDSGEMQEILDHFKKLTKEGITVLFTHHNRKKAYGKSNNEEQGEDSRGSTAINAGVHGHISCEEKIKEDGKYILISQRKLKCDEKMKPFLVKIDADKTNNKMSFNYIGEFDAKEETLRKNKEYALRFIEKSGKWVSKKEIAVFLGVSETTIAKALQELEKEGLVHSKTKKELDQENIPTNDPDAKHNAKFYFGNSNKELADF